MALVPALAQFLAPGSVRTSIRVHAPYPVPGWEMCLLSVNSKKRKKKKFKPKDTLKIVPHANKGNYGPRRGRYDTVLFYSVTSSFFFIFFFFACSLVLSFDASVMIHHSADKEHNNAGILYGEQQSPKRRLQHAKGCYNQCGS